METNVILKGKCHICFNKKVGIVMALSTFNNYVVAV
jgi:hypothetical protein